MKRILLLIPEALDFEMLAPEQQQAISNIFGSFQMPMPQTKPYNGFKLCDATTADNFDHTVMADYGMPWEILGMWQWDGKSDSLKVIVPLNEEKYISYLMPEWVEHEDGTCTQLPPRLREVANRCGWPSILEVA